MKKDDKDVGREEIAKSLSLIGSLGFTMLACIGVGFGIGLLLDRWLGTGFLAVVFIFVGVAAGMIRVYQMVMKTLE